MKNTFIRHINLYMDLVEGEGTGPVFKCNQCGFVLCPQTEDWKKKSRILEEDLYSAMDRYHITAIPATDRKLLFKQYFCPGCLVALDNDIVEAIG
jgi:acetone carboxylase gamma subunit